MTKHTPVPWEVIGRSVYQIDEAGGREVIHGSGIKGRDSEERDRQDVIEEQEANARFIVTACNNYEKLTDAVDELLEVADHRGDNQLPAPADDPKLWTSRMQDAWDELARLREESAK